MGRSVERRKMIPFFSDLVPESSDHSTAPHLPQVRAHQSAST